MNKYISYIALAGVILLGAVVLVGNNQNNIGADVANTRYPHGINITESGCLAIDGTCVIDSSGNFDGAVTGTTGTFSSTLAVTGTTTVATKIGVSTTTPRDLLHVEGTTASSTALITSGGAGGGRLILEDSDGAGCSEIYILNGTIISATVTCPTGI